MENINIYCNKCGKKLDNLATKNRSDIIVDPCPNCLLREYDNGYSCGYDIGYENGFRDV